MRTCSVFGQTSDADAIQKVYVPLREHRIIHGYFLEILGHMNEGDIVGPRRDTDTVE